MLVLQICSVRLKLALLCCAETARVIIAWQQQTACSWKPQSSEFQSLTSVWIGESTKHEAASVRVRASTLLSFFPTEY